MVGLVCVGYVCVIIEFLPGTVVQVREAKDGVLSWPSRGNKDICLIYRD